jgi:hypothetical protein
MEIFQVPMVFEQEKKEYKIEQFEGIKTSLTQLVSKYKNLVVSEDAISEAKTDRAYLNKRKKFINDERIRLERNTIGVLKEQCKELMGIIDEAVENIDTQIKVYEEKNKQDKLTEVAKIYEEFGSECIPFERVLKKEWLNKTYSLMNIKEEILQVTRDFESNKDALHALCENTAEWELALKVLIDTLSLPESIAKLNEVKKIAKLQSQAKAFAPTEELDTKKYTIRFEVKATRHEIEDLSQYLSYKNIDFKQIKD